MTAGSADRINTLLAEARQRHQTGGDTAEPFYSQILALDPSQLDALHGMGVLALQTGRYALAVELFGRAIAIRGNEPGFHSNLGAAFRGLGRLDEAVASYRRAIDLRPDFAALHSNLGNALSDLGRLEEAAASYRRAVELQPKLAEAHNNFGNVLSTLGRFDEAKASYQRALDLKPDYVAADSNRLLCLLYAPDLSAEALLAEHRGWDLRHGRRLAQPAGHPNPRDPGRRLRIGYVSPDLCNHPVGIFLANVLAAHDREAVEVFCYSNRVREDGQTARLRASADHWRSILGTTDDAAEQIVRDDGVDILVDLAGHTAENRLPLFTRRPAPVQASWLGYPATTGLSSIDYILMDAAAAPPGADAGFSEAVVRLPYGRFCYAPPDYAPAVAEPLPKHEGMVTFGSFNNLAKVGPDVVRLWAAVLKATPNSRLALKWKFLGDPATRRRLTEAFAEAGVAPERLDLRGASPHGQMLAEYGGIDIALDPAPFCGGLTSCEALWMGTPVVTLPGKLPASRQTLGFLDALGLGDLAAGSEAEYVRIAATLAADPRRRTALRRSLRPRMAAAPMCDSVRFTTALEAAFREMWRRWCAGEPVEAFEPAGAKTL